MPPAVVVDDDDDGALAAPCAPEQPAASWRTTRSPSSANVGPVHLAMPKAVDTRPSIPLAPRLARTRTPSRGAMNASTSRMGMLEPGEQHAALGIAAARSRATRPSNGVPRG